MLSSTDYPAAEERLKELREQADDLPARASVRLQAPEHVEEIPDDQMLTQNLQRLLTNNETPLGDINLDEQSPSNQVGQPRYCDSQARETMAMISQLTLSQLHQHKEPSSLKQGKFQSLCNYMVAGQLFIDATPKRKESAVVEAFIDGMHNAKQRMRFEIRLDERGWIWDNVNDVARDMIAEEAETQRQTRLAVSGPVHLEEGQSTTKCGGTSPMLAAKGTVPTEARFLPPKQVRSKVAATPPRRSQRIRRASQARTAYTGKGNAVNSHKAPEMVITSEHVRETGEKSKRVTLISPNKTQDQNSTSLCRKSVEMVRSTPCTKCNRHAPCIECVLTDLSCTRRTDGPPQREETADGNEIQEQTRRAGNTAKEGAQNLNAVTDAIDQQPQVPRPFLQRGSQKRPRECEVEVPSKLVHDLETPMRQDNAGAQPKSPKQKRRKKRRAVSPIPMIPILPLTDEED